MGQRKACLMAEGHAEQARVSSAEPDYAGLVSGLRRAEPAACTALCRHFGPRIHRLAAARLSGDPQLAEDVMVQTLVDAVRNIARFNPGRSTLAAWLYGIARRQIGLEVRRQRRRKAVPPAAEVPIDSVAEARDPLNVSEAAVARLDAQRQVSDLAGVLSDIEFEVLVLNCVDRLSAREIGQIVRRSERGIHSLLHRARQKARRRLMQDEDRAD